MFDLDIFRLWSDPKVYLKADPPQANSMVSQYEEILECSASFDKLRTVSKVEPLAEPVKVQRLSKKARKPRLVILNPP